MMRTFEVNDNGDWTLSTVEGDAELIQNLKHLVITRVGEWFLDRDQGFRVEVVERKDVTKSEILQAIYDALYQEPRVLEVISASFDFDRKLRELTVIFSVRTETGTIGGEAVADR